MKHSSAFCNDVKKVNNKTGRSLRGEVTQRFTSVSVAPRRLREEEEEKKKRRRKNWRQTSREGLVEGDEWVQREEGLHS